MEKTREFKSACKIMLVFIFLLLVLCAFGNCQLPQDGANPADTIIPVAQDPIDRASMAFEIEGVRYEGAVTIDRKSSQVISFVLPKNTIKFMITTCNREEFFPYPDFSKPFKYTYIPIMYLENVESCFMTATAITNKAETFRSVIDFRSGETLAAKLACNGKVFAVTGAAFCQSREGLIQRISFNEPVVAVGQEGCPPLVEKYNEYEFKVSPGFCAYKFMNKNKDKLRLTTLGYTVIREVVSDK